MFPLSEFSVHLLEHVRNVFSSCSISESSSQNQVKVETWIHGANFRDQLISLLIQLSAFEDEVFAVLDSPALEVSTVGCSPNLSFVKILTKLPMVGDELGSGKARTEVLRFAAALQSWEVCLSPCTIHGLTPFPAPFPSLAVCQNAFCIRHRGPQSVQLTTSCSFLRQFVRSFVSVVANMRFNPVEFDRSSALPAVEYVVDRSDQFSAAVTIAQSGEARLRVTV